MRSRKHCEVIRDEAGNVLGTVQVTQCLTDEERDAMRKLMEWAASRPVDPERQARYEASQARIRERNARLGIRRD